MSNGTINGAVASVKNLSFKEEMVVLPLKKWQGIENELEDLEMYRSGIFAKEIARSRAGKKTIPLASLLKKYRVSG